MSLHEPCEWLVTYDVSDRRRAGRVLKQMKKHGLPVQYSVFLVRKTGAAMHALMRDIERLIDSKKDDVRAYRIPVDTEWRQVGGTRLPDGVVLGAGALEGAIVLSRPPGESCAHATSRSGS